MSAWPLLGFLAWRDGGLDFASPIFMLATLFVTLSGPLQTLAAWRLAAPELRRHPRWFVVRRPGQRGRLHRVQEPHRPGRAPQAAARRAPLGRHPAHGAEQRPPRRRTRRLPRRWPHDGRRDHYHARRTPRTLRARARSADRVTYPLTWLRGLAALAVLVFHAYQHNRTGTDSAWPWSGGAAPGDARHRAVRRDVLRAVRLRALAAGRARRRSTTGSAVPAGCCCSAGWRGCCRSTTRWCSSSGRPPTRRCPGTGRTCCCT